jgi:hypothetical protein
LNEEIAAFVDDEGRVMASNIEDLLQRLLELSSRRAVEPSSRRAVEPSSRRAAKDAAVAGHNIDILMTLL